MPGKLPVYKARVKRDADGALKASYKKKPEGAAKTGGAAKTAKTAKEERVNPLFLWEEEPAARRAAARRTNAARLKPDDSKEKKPAKPAAKTAAKAQPKASKPEARKEPAKAAAEKKPAQKKVSPAKSVYKSEDGRAKRKTAPAGKREMDKKQETARRTGRIRPAEEAGREKQRRDRRSLRNEKKKKAMFRDRKLAVSRSPGFAVTVIALLTAAFEALGMLLAASGTPGVLDTRALTILCAIVPLGLATSVLLPRFLPVEPLLMSLTNFLCGLGVVILYTVSPERGARQAAFYAVGLVLMLIISGIVSRIRRWKGLTVLSMLLGIGALVLPLAFGEWQGGAKNWVTLPLLGSFQPSELVKLSIVLTLAYYFSAHRTVLQMMPAILFAGACLVLLMLQRDLGTALIYYLTTLVLFYAACGNVPLTVLGLGGGAGAAVMGYRMFAHVKVRVAMWRNPWSDPLDKGYQIIQALLAIGSGGLFGVGLGQGTPDMIPAYHNDFIFAVICEQMGLVFGFLTIAVYLLIIMRGVTIISRTRRSFDMLLGCGVLAMLAIQTFMIVGGVVKMIPLTGVTMPFLSYGGSSLLSCLAMMGILHGVSARVQEDLEDDVFGA
ncbi:MAG: FtsW/RodA/SpoVE family cell cycle protein [Clostridia bacterium]|nr:FtsW/RodA/SpoVE family cell cycle protein [Clostridia bacterium]